MTGCRLAFGQLSIWYNKRGNMAREIRETPILYGEDARRNYELFKKAYERGMAKMRAREAANGGDDPCFRTV